MYFLGIGCPMCIIGARQAFKINGKRLLDQMQRVLTWPSEIKQVAWIHEQAHALPSNDCSLFALTLPSESTLCNYIDIHVAIVPYVFILYGWIWQSWVGASQRLRINATGTAPTTELLLSWSHHYSLTYYACHFPQLEAHATVYIYV